MVLYALGREKRTLNGFLVYGRRCTRALEIHRLCAPTGLTAEASGIERKRCLEEIEPVRKKRIHTDIRKRMTQSHSIFLFPFPTDLVKVSLVTKRERRLWMYETFLVYCWFSVIACCVVHVCVHACVYLKVWM